MFALPLALVLAIPTTHQLPIVTPVMQAADAIAASKDTIAASKDAAVAAPLAFAPAQDTIAASKDTAAAAPLAFAPAQDIAAASKDTIAASKDVVAAQGSDLGPLVPYGTASGFWTDAKWWQDGLVIATLVDANGLPLFALDARLSANGEVSGSLHKLEYAGNPAMQAPDLRVIGQARVPVRGVGSISLIIFNPLEDFGYVYPLGRIEGMLLRVPTSLEGAAAEYVRTIAPADGGQAAAADTYAAVVDRARRQLQSALHQAAAFDANAASVDYARHLRPAAAEFAGAAAAAFAAAVDAAGPRPAAVDAVAHGLGSGVFEAAAKQLLRASAFEAQATSGAAAVEANNQPQPDVTSIVCYYMPPEGDGQIFARWVLQL